MLAVGWVVDVDRRRSRPALPWGCLPLAWALCITSAGDWAAVVHVKRRISSDSCCFILKSKDFDGFTEYYV
ncbi:hypothetical protein NDU88_003480 [Pleurodeles waltl]|uniref:Secreted protein n=1 Tax=Pleurodeles waltl TaxID=8319 RepID=A0AAV7W5E6_PLEWA|nr:hypothetical protein NDU88_003480 [Pleurodeles waltl]